MKPASVSSLLLLLSLITWADAAFKQTLVYEWVAVEYDWPTDEMMNKYNESGQYIVENNIITGLKVYKDEVYLTVPRWRRGVPSSLNRVVMKGGRPVLQPYPSWEYQQLGNCSAFQYVMSMEIDPNTGLMWIIDTGRVDFLDTTPARNLCPPKLVIYDIENEKQVHSYTFPNEVANRSSCFLDDLVLDYVDGDVKFAYITDTLDAKLYVYDYERDTSYVFQDPSMLADTEGGFPIDGIAMSAQFDFVYFCPLDSDKLFQIPTVVLRDPQGDFGKHVRQAGTRRSRTGGMTYGQNSLMYGMIDLHGVQRWNVAADASQTGGYDKVTMTSEEEVVRDDVRMRFPDTFGWDGSGNMWFTANDLMQYLNRSQDFSGNSGPNVYVWKVYMNESSYLTGARQRTSSPFGDTSLASTVPSALRTAVFIACFISWLVFE